MTMADDKDKNYEHTEHIIDQVSKHLDQASEHLKEIEKRVDRNTRGVPSPDPNRPTGISHEHIKTDLEKLTDKSKWISDRAKVLGEKGITLDQQKKIEKAKEEDEKRRQAEKAKKK